MSLNVCAHCTTRFAIGVPYCPQCGNADFYQEGSEMAKISRHGGPSDASVEISAPSDEEFLEELAAAEPVGAYEPMLRAELQAELAARGLPTSGNKADLVARLETNDEENEMTEPEITEAEVEEAQAAEEAAADEAGAEEPSAAEA